MMRRLDGFSLLEVLVATALVLVLTGGVFLVALPTFTGFGREPAANELQERMRVAADLLLQQLREAGGGPRGPSAGAPLGLAVPAVWPCRLGTRRPDASGTFRTDVMTIVSSSAAAAATVVGPFQGSPATVVVQTPAGCPLGHPACGLEAGMTVLALDAGGQADFYGVAFVGLNVVTLEARGPQSGRRYNAGAQLIPVTLSTLYLRPASGADGPQLAAYDGNASDLPVVDHVVALAFEYYGEPQPPRLRTDPGPVGETMTYGPRPPAPGEDDDRDEWGPGENCVVTLAGGQQAPRLAELGPPNAPLQLLEPASLTDGPWCPDAAAASRFDADLLRVRKVRVALRLEAWSAARRGRDPRWFLSPGTSRSAAGAVADELATFDVVLRVPGGTR